jgi:hypothetical protein
VLLELWILQEGAAGLRCGSPDGEAASLGFRGEVADAHGTATLIRRLTDRNHVPAEEILALPRHDHNGAFSHPIKAALDELHIAYPDPDVVERISPSLALWYSTWGYPIDLLGNN